MNFGASDPLQDYQISEFGGVDFSTLGNKVSMARSPDAVNMMLNHNGYLEKRTGYRRLYQGDERINGIFDYTPKDAAETFYFMHIGTKLYCIAFGENGSIEPGELLMSDLKDVKSRHFVFNDRLYIIGCGYIQIRYRDGAIEYGHVKNIETTEESVEVKADGELQYVPTDASLRAVRFALSERISTREQTIGARINFATELKIQTTAASVKIRAIYVLNDANNTWKEWDLKYAEISNDGKMISLLGNDIFGAGVVGYTRFENAFYFQNVKVEYSEGTGVAAPLMFINRTAVPAKYWVNEDHTADNTDRIWEYDSYNSGTWVEDEFLGRLPLDGDAVDAANFAHGRRKVQFLIPEDTDNVLAYVLYLTDKKSAARVNRITVDGNVLHNYNDTSTYVHSAGSDTVVCDTSVWPIINIDKDGRFVKIERIAWHNNNSTNTYKDYPVNRHIEPGSIIEVDFTVLRDGDSDDEQISECSIYGIYGGNNDTRVFLSGNPKFRNRDYASGLYDATYFPNNMYTDVGSESSAIVGYQKLYSNQIIVKDDATEDASQYLRSLNIDESGNVTYTLIQGHSTYGSSCTSSFKQVSGLPFYIGPGGVYTIAGTTVQNQNNTTLRSQQINKRFLTEDLVNAVCCRFEDNYIVATGTHIWYCDTQHGLEWFYFEGLPEITCIWPHKDSLYFGTADGRVCVFSKRKDENAYYDNLNPDKSTDGAEPVKCYWCTPISAFDNWNMYKTIVNVYLSIMPHTDTSVHVYYNSSDDIDEDITTEDVRLFDFNDIDFGNFSFDGIRQPKPFATGVKSKNVYVFGVKLANDHAQPFGIVSVGYKYKYSKYVK